jgi:L-cystine transport system permease protein
MSFDIEFVLNTFPKILKAVPMTLFISIFSITLGLIIGLIIAICRNNNIPILKTISAIFVSFIRGTPIIVQLYVVFYGFPELLTYLHESLGWKVSPNGISPISIALIAFTLNAAAYLSENIRSALNSVNKGQLEAAYSIGMTSFQSYRRIILPQALVSALPNFSNVFLQITKDTSLAFSVMVVEIMAVSSVEAAAGYKYLEAYLDAAIVYFIVCYIFAKLFVILENRLKRYKNISI